MNLTDTHILIRLARYRFLTIGQLAGMGVANEKTIRVHLKALETARLIGKQHFHLGPSVGKLPNVYWLTPKGAKEVQEGTGAPVVAPKPRTLSPFHVHHRMLTVDALIAADSCWNNLEFDTYMQWQGKQPVTGLYLGQKQAIADGVLRMVDSTGLRRVYVLEVYCSEARAAFSRKQLEPYLNARDTLDASLGIGTDEKAARVLVVCDTTGLRDKVIAGLVRRAGLPASDDAVWQRLLFKTADDIAPFSKGWHTIQGNRLDLPI